MGGAAGVGARRVRLGLVADVHGNSVALDAVLEAVRQDGVDHLVFLGDLCGYYPFVEECVAHWPAGVIGVRGNHDQVLLDAFAAGAPPIPAYTARYGTALRRALDRLSPAAAALLRALPVSNELTLAGVHVAMYHGAPWDPLHGRVYPDFTEWNRFDAIGADVVFLGHTHYPLVHRVGGRLIVNPGSVGQPRDRSGLAAYALVDLPTGAVVHRRVRFDTSRLIDDARLHDPGFRYLEEVLTR